MRILLASDHFPPYIGGAHRQIQLLSNELYHRGHEVSVATVWQPGSPEFADINGVQVYRLRQIRTLLTRDKDDHIQRHQPPFPDPVTVIALRRLIHKFQPDIIHSHGWFSYSCAIAMLGTHIPLLISGRDYGYSCATRTMLYHDRLCSGPKFAKCLECAAGFYGAPKGVTAVISLKISQPWLRRKINAVHSVSGFTQEIIDRDFIAAQRSKMEKSHGPILEKVIPSFLVNQDSKADPEFIKRLPGDAFILFVGGLQPRKGMDTLLAAYQLLKMPAPPLVVIGYASAEMPQSYPQGVIVLLDEPHSHVMLAWERCLFGVMPSIWPDPSPGVIREAFSKGKAVICTNLGGSPEMITDGDTGLLVPPGDVTALAHSMQRLIDDGNLRSKLSQAALSKAVLYQAENIVPQFERFYHQILEAAAK